MLDHLKRVGARPTRCVTLGKPAERVVAALFSDVSVRVGAAATDAQNVEGLDGQMRVCCGTSWTREETEQTTCRCFSCARSLWSIDQRYPLCPLHGQFLITLPYSLLSFPSPSLYPLPGPSLYIPYMTLIYTDGTLDSFLQSHSPRCAPRISLHHARLSQFFPGLL